MNQILPGILALLLAAGVAQSQSLTNSVQGDAGDDIPVDTNNAEGQELEKVMQDDDAALDEVDKWIQENNAFATQGAGESKKELNQRILARLQLVRKSYEDYLMRYPTNAAAYLAFGSYLDTIGDEDGASTQYEISRKLNPKNPAVWNDLANYYGENGPLSNSFAYYTKAIELNPAEPVYYENFATTVYLFRRDAMRFYGITEPQVFDKALALYQKAIQLDPNNLVLMTDYAESYYGIKPLRTTDALVAWTNALQIAHNDFEREGVEIHLARTKMLAGLYTEAQGHLAAVTNSDYPAYQALKDRIQRSILQREKDATNSTTSDVLPAATNHVSDLASPPPTTPGQKTP